METLTLLALSHLYPLGLARLALVFMVFDKVVEPETVYLKKKNVLNTYSTGLLSSAKTWCQLASQWCSSMSHESTPLRKSKLPFLKPSNKWNGYTKNPQWSQSDKKLYTEQQVCHRLDVLHCFGVCVMYNEVTRPRCYNNPALGDTRL